MCFPFIVQFAKFNGVQKWNANDPVAKLQTITTTNIQLRKRPCRISNCYHRLILTDFNGGNPQKASALLQCVYTWHIWRKDEVCVSIYERKKWRLILDQYVLTPTLDCHLICPLAIAWLGAQSGSLSGQTEANNSEDIVTPQTNVHSRLTPPSTSFSFFKPALHQTPLNSTVLPFRLFSSF